MSNQRDSERGSLCSADQTPVPSGYRQQRRPSPPLSTRAVALGVGDETTGWERHQPRRPTRPRLPVRPGDAALWRRRPRPPSPLVSRAALDQKLPVSHELLNSKHKSSSLAGIARTAAFGQEEPRRRHRRCRWSYCSAARASTTTACLLSPLRAGRQQALGMSPCHEPERPHRRSRTHPSV